MSTAITSVYDDMLTRLATLLPSLSGWSRLPNAYAVQDNPLTFLQQGYGLAVAETTNTKQLLSKTMSQSRLFRVVLSRQVYATDLDVSGFDSAAKQLLEDARTIMGDFEQTTTLNNGQWSAEFVQDSGIQFVNAEKENFIYIEVLFSVRIFETLS